MKFNLTRKIQCSKHCPDGKHRNFVLYFLNNVLILKQKFPYDENWEHGFDECTRIYDEYILNGRIHQTRQCWHGCGSKLESKPRQVSFPLSKIKLAELNVPKDFKISIDGSN